MGKEWHQINNTLDYINCLEVESAERFMWGPEMLSELSQVTQWVIDRSWTTTHTSQLDALTSRSEAAHGAGKAHFTQQDAPEVPWAWRDHIADSGFQS